MRTNGTDIQVKSNNCIVTYNESGDHQGDPLIFIHGFPLDKSMWKPQEELSSLRKIISYDIRGFGLTKNNGEEITIDLLADDLIAFMDILEIPKAILNGFSMGGYIALNAEQRYPERVSGLILTSTQCNADSEEGREGRFKSIEDIRSNGLNQFALKFAPKLINQETSKELVAPLVTTINDQDAESVCNTLKALASRSERCTNLHHMDKPVLIICGDKDNLIPCERSQFMQSKIKNSRLVTISNAAHLCNMEQPGLYNAAIKGYLQSF